MKPSGATPAPPPDRRCGFALVEVLAALVVTAAFVAVCLPFAGRLIDRWAAGGAAIDRADRTMQAVRRLSDDIAQALPIVRQEGGRTRIVFGVAPDRVEVVRPTLGGSGRDGLEVVTYAIRRSGAGDTLRRSARAFSVAAAEGTAPVAAETIILDGPVRLRFSAVAADGVRSETWTSPDSLPSRIDLAVTALSGAVPLRVALPLGARIGPAEGASPVQ